MASRWSDFLTSDGEKPNRNRDLEFEDTIASKQELISTWENGRAILFDTLSTLKERDLLTTVYILGESHTVLEAIERQLAHYAYHVGQLVFIGKQIKDADWQSLNTPKGQSENYLQQKLKKKHSL